MTSFVRFSVRKYRDIKNGEQYTILDIFSKIDCPENREFTSSESKNYMVIRGKGVTTSMYFMTKRPNNKQKSGFYITDINR